MVTLFFWIIIITGVFVLSIPYAIIRMKVNKLIIPSKNVIPRKITIVFGAGLWRDGTPTPVLRDRVETASDLYLNGNTKILLMSGDNRFINYNEPEAMKQYAIKLGVPAEAIVLDYAGRRTYDTCYRAKHIFGVNEAILVTQRFHLPRALYLCDQLGIKVVGVPAENRIFQLKSRIYWFIREIIAAPIALWEIHVTKPLPVLGNPEPITFDNNHDT